MIRTLALLLLLAGCTTAKLEHVAADGSRTDLSFTRVWSDTSVTITPDGGIAYTSDADSAVAATALERGIALGLGMGAR